MHPRRISFTLFDRSSIKQQLDNLIDADYGILNQHPNQERAILNCQLAHNNQIIRQYIHVVEQEYNVPNPLNKQPQRVSSNKKIELSMLNSSKELFENRNTDKNKKKLTLTTPSKEPQLANSQKRQNTNEIVQINTPKFCNYDGTNFGTFDRIEAEGSVNRKSHTNSANKLQSKEKPYGMKPQQSNLTAKKPIITFNQSQISQKSHSNFNSRSTIKRQYHVEGNYSESSIAQGQDHSNPILSKMQKKKLQDYCRPSRITNSIIKQDACKKLKIRDSYRYCIGCERPILQANIRIHEKECKLFQEIACLPSNQQILKIVKSKIANIERTIPDNNSSLDDQNLKIIRNRSASLVRQSKNRVSCSPQTTHFTKDYQAIMKVGQKLSSSLQQVNKLRWFTRIAKRLEQIVAQQQT